MSSQAGRHPGNAPQSGTAPPPLPDMPDAPDAPDTTEQPASTHLSISIPSYQHLYYKENVSQSRRNDSKERPGCKRADAEEGHGGM